MARPQKHTIEYFSHDADASEGRTLSILFNHFQHEGISAWWLLLERISLTDNHVIGIRNPEDFEYLASKLHFAPVRLRLILDKMAELDAIDLELYRHGIIWSQNFVNRLDSVYKSRKQSLPSKPELSVQETPLSGKETSLSIPETPQTKLKETILNNSVSGKPAKSPDKKLSYNHLIAQMQEHLGYPAIVDKDPVPNPAKEGKFIKKMKDRGFSDDEIMFLWRAKVKAKNNNFVSMQWVNEDIGKKFEAEKGNTYKKGAGPPRRRGMVPQGNYDASVCETAEDLERMKALREEYWRGQ